MRKKCRAGLCVLLAAAAAALLTVTAGAGNSALMQKQAGVHEIAEMARALGLPEDDAIIKRASALWWEWENQKTEEPALTYTEKDAVMLAKLVKTEAGGLDYTEQSAVIWCVLNRADRWGMTIEDVITAPGQFAYHSGTAVQEDFVWLAHDVLNRWEAEKAGQKNAGRTLPEEYLWFSGDGRHNYFRDAYRGGNVWDWSLESPY